MSCPTCKGTCEVCVKVKGVLTTDACPRCAQRAEIEYQALVLGWPTWKPERIAAE